MAIDEQQRASEAGAGGPPGTVTSRAEKGWRVLALSGRWTTDSLAGQGAALAEAAATAGEQVRLDISEVEALDSAGAWLVCRTLDELDRPAAKIELVGGDAEQRSLIDTMGRYRVGHQAEPSSENAINRVLIRTGKATYEACAEARDLIAFLGHAVVVFGRTIVNPGRLRFIAMVSHMEQAGLNAMPIVGLLSFLIGVVLAYQGADQLARFGAQIFTVNLVGIGVLREMGIILTAIIVAGRSGSAFTAQIGTMKVNEEIDALRTIGLDPMDVLVMPRVFALVLVMPLLTFYADLMGVFGGAVMALFVLDISFERFIRQMQEAVPIWSFWVGIIKAPIFAFIIALVGCFEGLKVSRSAESVGLRTTTSVVESIFIVIVLDAIFSIFFSVIGI